MSVKGPALDAHTILECCLLLVGLISHTIGAAYCCTLMMIISDIDACLLPGKAAASKH
jgi:hypothetical protein